MASMSGSPTISQSFQTNSQELQTLDTDNDCIALSEAEKDGSSSPFSYNHGTRQFTPESSHYCPLQVLQCCSVVYLPIFLPHIPTSCREQRILNAKVKSVQY